jgi:hypothetical protein
MYLHLFLSVVNYITHYKAEITFTRVYLICLHISCAWNMETVQQVYESQILLTFNIFV